MKHIPAQPLHVSGRYVRQRCAWCGLVLLDVDIQNIGVLGGPPPTVENQPTYPLDKFVEVDGDQSVRVYSVADVDENDDGTGKLPDDCCAAVDPQVTA